MPDVKIARLWLDINVFYADLRARALRVRPSAASELVEYVSSGLSPAGGVQLIISVPMIEPWQNVLMRHFGFSKADAAELSSILHAYASGGPVALHPLLVVGSDFVPFASELEVQREARGHAGLSKEVKPGSTAKLFDEFTDDRHVLLTAIAGRADVLVTADIPDFRRGKIWEFGRDDVFVIPFAAHNLVVGRPSFVARWLRYGEITDWDFIASRPDEFALAV